MYTAELCPCATNATASSSSPACSADNTTFPSASSSVRRRRSETTRSGTAKQIGETLASNQTGISRSSYISRYLSNILYHSPNIIAHVDSIFTSTGIVFEYSIGDCIWIGVLASEGWQALQPFSEGNQEPLVVKDKEGRPQVGLGWASPWSVILFHSVLWHCWLGDRKGIQPVKMFGCWFVGGDSLTGALHVL